MVSSAVAVATKAKNAHNKYTIGFDIPFRIMRLISNSFTMFMLLLSPVIGSLKQMSLLRLVHHAVCPVYPQGTSPRASSLLQSV
jgi:hypothetical protein